MADDLYALLSRQIIDRVVRDHPGARVVAGDLRQILGFDEQAGDSMSVRPGQIDGARLNVVAAVHLDGDPDDVLVNAVVINRTPTEPGTRVAVLLNPPHGAFVIGAFGALADQNPSEVVPAGRLIATSTTGVAAQTAALVELGYVELAVGGVTAGTGSGTRLTLPRRGVYGASAQVFGSWDEGTGGYDTVDSSQCVYATTPGPLTLTWSGGTSTSYWTASGPSSLIANFDGAATIYYASGFENGVATGSPASLIVRLKKNGSTVHTQTIDCNDPAAASGFQTGFSYIDNAVHSGDTYLIEIEADGFVDPGGSPQDNACTNQFLGTFSDYFTATRTDPAPLQIALILRDEADNVLDCIAEGYGDESADASNAAFVANRGDYVELWARNPHDSVTAYVSAEDYYDNGIGLNLAAQLSSARLRGYTQMAVAWVGPGDGDHQPEAPSG